MEGTLRLLYRLQQIDTELDDLNDTGDLPKEIDALRLQVDIINDGLATEQQKLTDVRKSRGDAGVTAAELRDRIKQLNERVRAVRNNKEYEALSHELESAEAELNNIERSSTTTDTQEATIIRDTDSLEKQREELQTELDDKLATLESLRSANAEEVDALAKDRVSVAKQLSDELMKKYEHLRKAYGDAVVKVRRGACSGCYRSITPQTIVEMRKLELMYVCEHCGRILVLEEVVTSPEEAA